MYWYQIITKNLLSLRVDWNNTKGERETTVNIPPLLSEQNLHLLCRTTISECKRGAPRSAARKFNALKAILRFLNSTNDDLPWKGHLTWLAFIYNHYIFHLSDINLIKSNKPKNINTIKVQWRGIKSLYRRLQINGVIPKDIIIPSTKMPKTTAKTGSEQALGSAPVSIPPPSNTDELWPKTFLIDKTIGLSTDQFLESLQSKLETCSEATVKCCHEHWKKVIKCHGIGEQYINSVSRAELKKVIESGNFYVNGKHITDPDSPNGISWFLAAIDYYFCETDYLKLISYKTMKNIPILSYICGTSRNTQRANNKIREIAGNLSAPGTRINETLNRLLGHISARDCAAACIILIAENPKFSPMGLQHGDLLTKNNKPIFYVSSDDKKIIYGISKPRAGARKISIFPALSEEVFLEIIKATAKARVRLIRNGAPNYRKLFLTATSRWVGNPNYIEEMLATSNGINLFQLFEEQLTTAGIKKETLCLKRMRATQGLIAFLKNGTLQSVSATLGNSIAVVKSHYIPSWLIEKWSIRILRIFQAKLVVLSTRGQPWQLEASDFTTRENLFDFIIRAATETESKDPIGLELKDYSAELTESVRENLYKPLQKKHLILRLSVESLAAIFFYAERYNVSDGKGCMSDPSTGLSEDSISTLANLIDGAYSISSSETSNHVAKLNITGFSVPLFKKIYLDAKKLADEYLQEYSTATFTVIGGEQIGNK